MSADDVTAAFPAVDDPSRIVPLTGDLAEIVYTLGLGDQVVATDASATYPQAAVDAPTFGYQRTLNAETILTFEPTVVLAGNRAGPPEALDALRAVGVDVVVVDFENDLTAPALKVRAVAATLGVPERGEEVVAEYEAELAHGLEIADAAVERSGRPLVLGLYVRSDIVQLVFGDGSGIDAVIEAAGGRDLGTELGVDDTGELSTEAIIAAQPDFVLVTTRGADSVGGVDGVVALAGLETTPIAKDPARRVLQFDDQFLYGLGPRTGELITELATAIHLSTTPPSTTP